MTRPPQRHIDIDLFDIDALNHQLGGPSPARMVTSGTPPHRNWSPYWPKMIPVMKRTPRWLWRQSAGGMERPN